MSSPKPPSSSHGPSAGSRPPPVQPRVREVSETYEDLGYAVSHDLAAPARAVTGFVDLGLRNLAPDHKAHAMLTIARTQGRVLQEMLVEMAAYVRKLGEPAPELAACRLGGVAETAMEWLAERVKSSEADVRIGELPEVWASDEEMAILFAQVLDNAMLYTHPGEAPRVEVSTVMVDGQPQVHVRDHGMGIAKGQAHRAFRPLARLCSTDQYAGIGMGLAMARLIADRHGMTLSLQQPSEGEGVVLVLGGLTPTR